MCAEPTQARSVAPLNLEGVELTPGKPVVSSRYGELCPLCQEQRLDYDGLLNLVCPKCGILSGGCYT
jgi:hypothetical protein